MRGRRSEGIKWWIPTDKGRIILIRRQNSGWSERAAQEGGAEWKLAALASHAGNARLKGPFLGRMQTAEVEPAR